MCFLTRKKICHKGSIKPHTERGQLFRPDYNLLICIPHLSVKDISYRSASQCMMVTLNISAVNRVNSFFCVQDTMLLMNSLE